MRAAGPPAVVQHVVSAGLGAALAVLITRLLRYRDESSEQPREADEVEGGQTARSGPVVALAPLPTEAPSLRRHQSNPAGLRDRSLSLPHGAVPASPTHRSPRGQRASSKRDEKPPAAANQRSNAGDSDSGDDEERGPKIPRELLSPVPRNQLTSIVVFGADGNLARKKLLPTLYLLWRRRLLPRDMLVFGFARPADAGGELTCTDDFREWLLKLLEPHRPTPPTSPRGSKEDEENRDGHQPGEFVTRCHFATGQFGDVNATRELLSLIACEERKRASLRRSGLRWLQMSKKGGEGDGGGEGVVVPAARMYYLSVPPFLYAQICAGLADARAGAPSATESVQEQFVLEKPFGRCLATCTQLMSQLSMLKASETFYIDHYLGKELVMNLLVLRFANVCFGAIWNRQHIKSVQVIFKEKIGAEGRAGYFDQYGIIRDVMQNHLLQMVALVAMEQPLNLTAEHIRQEKFKVLNAIRPVKLEDMVTGQYAGYRDDPGIKDKQTRTETFAAAVLHVHNPRWDGVPFVLKAGKALNDSKVELRVQFHHVPGVVEDLDQCVANELVVLVQPEPAIYWKVQNKVPGLKFEVEQVRMDLLYEKSYNMIEAMPEAYERLLLEALVNDHSHFVSEEELRAQWRIFTPVLEELVAKQVEPEVYAYGSRGPGSADQLARRHGMTKFGGGLTPYVFVGDLLAGKV